MASGSSSVDVHAHLRESLAGRRITYRVFPLSWMEYRDWDSPNRPSFEDYLRYGGLPGLSTVGNEERKQQQNQGQLVEASSLARELGVSAPTVSNYLTVLDQTYVNFLLPSYHSNLANELKKSRKTYLYDLGIRNSILKDFRPTEERDDRGAIHESHVFLALAPLLSPNMELRFWRTKKKEEVDFILVKDRQPFPIEVKSRLSRAVPPPGLLAFCRRYPKVRQTFTVSARAFPPVEDEGRTHHFLGFEEVPTILDATRGIGPSPE